MIWSKLTSIGKFTLKEYQINLDESEQFFCRVFHSFHLSGLSSNFGTLLTCALHFALILSHFSYRLLILCSFRYTTTTVMFSLFSHSFLAVRTSVLNRAANIVDRKCIKVSKGNFHFYVRTGEPKAIGKYTHTQTTNGAKVTKWQQPMQPKWKTVYIIAEKCYPSECHLLNPFVSCFFRFLFLSCVSLH